MNRLLARTNILAALLICTFLGCTSPLLAQTQLTFRINNLKQNDSVWVSMTQFWVKEIQSRVALQRNSEGLLTRTIPISQPRVVYLSFRNQWLKLYVEPKKDLLLIFDVDSISRTIHFSGQLSPENTILHELGYTTYNMYPHAWTGGPTTPNAVVTQLLTDKKSQLTYFQQLKKTTSFSSDFYNLLEGEIRYKPALELANLLTVGLGRATRPENLAALQRVYDHEPLSEDRFLISDVYFYSVSRTEMSLLATCGSDSTCENQQIIQIYHVKDKSEFINKSRQYGQLYEEVDRASHFLTGRTLEKAMAMWIYGFKDDYGYLRTAYDLYKQRFPAGSHHALIEKSLQPFFAFEKRTLTGEQITFTPNPDLIADLSDLIRSHQGRAVYVDFWGTWCGPCRVEMPYSLDLQAKMRGQPIDFVYVANELGHSASRVSIWKAAIQQLRITGEHFMMTPAFLDSMRQQHLEVTQFPTYMLFDKAGKLVDANAAPPSSLATILAQLQEAMK